MKAYIQSKKNEAKVWSERTNASAWLFGRYVSMAIGHCFSKNSAYPDRPIPLGNEENAELPDSEQRKAPPESKEEREAKYNQKMITAQIIHAQSVLKRQNS